MDEASVLMVGFIGMGAFLVFLLIFILFLLSMSKMAISIRTENPETYVSRVWVWTQLIPLWGFIAFIVFHIKMQSRSVVFEKDHNLEIKHLGYPTVSGWFYALNPLYIWFPLVGVIVYLVMFIVFWVKVTGVSSKAMAIKYSKRNVLN